MHSVRFIISVTLITLSLGYSETHASQYAPQSYGLDPNSPVSQLLNRLPSSIDRLSQSWKKLQNTQKPKALLDHPHFDLVVRSRQTQNGSLETTRYQTYYKGIEVIGAEVHHRFSLKTFKNKVDSNQAFLFNLDTRPTVSESEALSLAQQSIGIKRSLSIPAELKILPVEGPNQAKLIYWLEFNSDKSTPSCDGGCDVLVDAHSGKVIASISHHMTLAPVDVHSAKEVDPEFFHPLSGRLLTHDPRVLTAMVENDVKSEDIDPSGNRAFRNVKKVLGFYKNELGRDSFDNQGTKIKSIVHAGHNMSNAYWHMKDHVMAYGPGDGKKTQDFTHALDVAGHEMSHGVISSTSNLIYIAQSGALNEAFADYFGELIEGKGDWIVGGHTFIRKEDQAKGMRNLKDPSQNGIYTQDAEGNIIKIPHPDHILKRFMIREGDKCGSSNDNCFVHLNSTIPSHAMYLIHQALGEEVAPELLYLVVTQYLKRTSNFFDFRASTLEACNTLVDSEKCALVEKVFDQVGIEDRPDLLGKVIL